MNMNAQTPLVDEENPFYCPNFPAAAYLATLRQALQSNSFLFHDLSLRSFFWKLGLCSAKEDEVYTSHSVAHDTLDVSLWPSSSDAESPPIPARNQVSDDVPILQRGLTGLAWRRPSSRVLKRPRDSSDSEDHIFLGGRPKRGCSSHSVHTSPVHISGIVPLSYNLRYPLEASYQDMQKYLEAWIYEADTGEDTPADLVLLIDRLEKVMPGTGIYRMLLGDPLAILHLTHQKIANLLADRGLLTENVLILLRSGNIDRLELGPTMCEEDGLNMPSSNLLHVFSRPDYYTNLKELVLNGAHLERDFDLVHIQRLPNLEKLYLEATDIGNEAVFLLVNLKEKLYFLDLARNPKINDDAIPAILLFANLAYLSIQATGVDMPGLRRLAIAVYTENRAVDIEIPFKCEKYIDNLHKQYIVNPVAPLITDPSACSLLSNASLTRNLDAHAAVNPSIVSTGTRLDMIERLMKLLERRQMDLTVRSMMFGDSEDMEVQG